MHENGKVFLKWFNEHKRQKFLKSVIASVRERSGLGKPPVKFTTNRCERSKDLSRTFERVNRVVQESVMNTVSLYLSLYLYLIYTYILIFILISILILIFYCKNLSKCNNVRPSWQSLVKGSIVYAKNLTILPQPAPPIPQPAPPNPQPTPIISQPTAVPAFGSLPSAPLKPPYPRPQENQIFVYLLRFCPQQTSVCFGCGNSLKANGIISPPPLDLVLVSNMMREWVFGAIFSV